MASSERAEAADTASATTPATASAASSSATTRETGMGGGGQRGQGEEGFHHPSGAAAAFSTAIAVLLQFGRSARLASGGCDFGIAAVAAICSSSA